MIVTALTPRQFSVGQFLWLKVPIPIRVLLKAGVPHDTGEWDGSKGLLVAVGSPTPMRWLYLTVRGLGTIHGELHQVQAKGIGTKLLGEEDCQPQELEQLLRKWAVEFQLT